MIPKAVGSTGTPGRKIRIFTVTVCVAEGGLGINTVSPPPPGHETADPNPTFAVAPELSTGYLTRGNYAELKGDNCRCSGDETQKAGWVRGDARW